jgi:hypothetical protein
MEKRHGETPRLQRGRPRGNGSFSLYCFFPYWVDW